MGAWRIYPPPMIISKTSRNQVLNLQESSVHQVFYQTWRWPKVRASLVSKLERMKMKFFAKEGREVRPCEGKRERYFVWFLWCERMKERWDIKLILWCKSQHLNSSPLVLLIEFNSTHSPLIPQLTFLNLPLITFNSPRPLHSPPEYYLEKTCFL